MAQQPLPPTPFVPPTIVLPEPPAITPPRQGPAAQTTMHMTAAASQTWALSITVTV